MSHYCLKLEPVQPAQMKATVGLTDLAKLKKLFVSPVTMFDDPRQFEKSAKINKTPLCLIPTTVSIKNIFVCLCI